MMPIIDFNATYSWAQLNPTSAAAVILLLLLGFWGVYKITKKEPYNQKLPKLIGYGTMLVGALWLSWGMFRSPPSVMAEINATVQKYQQIQDNGIEVAIINVNRNPGPGDRVTFMDVQGQQCSYFGVIKPERYVAITRRQCPGELQKLVTMYVPLDKGPLGASGQRNFMAYPLADTKSLEVK